MEDDTAAEILEATYRALCRHGYADLTLADVAAEADTSKALIHYYYDSKENLFTEFLEFLYERYTTRLDAVEGETAGERLLALLDTVLVDDGETSDTEFRMAMLGVNAQAPYDDAIRDRLARFDEFLFERLRAVIADGVDAGEFHDDVEPDVAAEFLVTAITGANTRRVTVDRSTERLHEAMNRYVETHLLADGTTEVAP